MDAIVMPRGGGGVGALGQRTLDLEHNHILNKLKARRTNAANLRLELEAVTARVQELEAKPKNRMTDAEFDELRNASYRADVLMRELDAVEAGGDEVEYYMRTAPILFKYYDIIDKGGGGGGGLGGNEVGGGMMGGGMMGGGMMGGSGGGGGVDGSKVGGMTPPAKRRGGLASGLASASSHVPANSILHFFKGGSAGTSPSVASDGDPLATHCSPAAATATEGHDRATLLERYMSAVDATMPSRYTTTTQPAPDAAAGPTASAPRRSVGDGMGVREPPPAPATVSRGAAFLASSSAAVASATQMENAATEVCKHCGHVGPRTLMLHDGYVFCRKCYTVEYILVDHDKPSYKDMPKEIAYLAYKRINHFNEWLNQVQGKETTEIPDEVYDSILLEVKKMKITNMADLNRRQVKSILKKLRINKFYEHCVHILQRLNGMPSPHIPPELEDRLRHMFCTIQLPFLKHAPVQRKNFLSYSYVLHKMMQLLDHDEYLQFFCLLKARDKLSAQDVIWKKICAEVGWDFIPSL